MTSEKLRQWLCDLHADMERNSPQALFALLRGSTRNEDLTVPVLNNAMAVVKAVFPKEGQEAQTTLYLYYKLLQLIIEEGMKGGELLSGMEDTMMKRLRNSRFHDALLCCSAEVVSHAFQGRTFPWVAQAIDRGNFLADVWIVTSYALSAINTEEWPSSVITVLRDLQTTLLQDYCLLHHSVMYSYLLEGGGCLHLPQERTMAIKFIMDFGQHTSELTREIIEPFMDDADGLPEEFYDMSLDLVDLVLCRHFYLFFERCLIVPILCCVYCVGRICKTGITFKQLSDRCASLFSATRVAAFAVVLMENPKPGATSFTYGTICRFYNETFLKTCRREIVSIQSQGVPVHVKPPL